ncbi:MAG: hypothetical protein WC668_05050 [Patescibacteria group bacterium]|jgi:hypothetical protein
MQTTLTEKDQAELLSQAELGKKLFGKKIKAKYYQGSALLIGVIAILALAPLTIVTVIIAVNQLQWSVAIGHTALLCLLLIIGYCFMRLFNQVIFELKCYRIFWWEMEDAKQLINSGKAVPDNDPPGASNAAA